jgi:hypothetical protein
MQRFELFHILEGQPCRIGSAESFDDANAQGAQLDDDYLIVDTTTGQHIRINKLVPRGDFD